MSYKRPEVKRESLQEMWRNHTWLLRIFALVMAPLWIFAFIPMWLWHTRDTAVELAGELWDLTEIIWAKIT